MGRALEVPTAAPLIPPHPTLPLLRKLAACCHACDLYQRATQTVFGEGGKSARAMMVGEQPGDVEDQLVELELQRLAVPVLRRLDEDLPAFLLQRGLPDLGEVRAHAPSEVFLWGLKEAEAISIARAGALRRPSRCSDARNERREPGDRTSDDANRGELVYRRWSATMEGLLARRV